MKDTEIRQAKERLQPHLERIGHSAFKVGGKWYEGYILEIRERSILFCWAPSPFDPTEEDVYEEISMDSIDFASLK
jgi:hypothetical protein